MKTKPFVVLSSLIVAAVLIGVLCGGPRHRSDTAAIGTPSGQGTPSSLDKTAAIADLGVHGNSDAREATVVISPVKWVPAILPPSEKASSKASRNIIASGLLQPGSIQPLGRLRAGQRVKFPLGSNPLEGLIGLVVPDESGHVCVGGRLVSGGLGEFTLSESTATGEIKGHILDRKNKVGYAIEFTKTGGVVHKKPIDALACLMPRYKGPIAAAQASSGPQALTVPSLNSKPGAVGVLYLDFDGETVTDPSWNSGVTIVAASATLGSSAITSAQITDVWQRVAEDYRPFDLNVTTDAAKYAAAPVGHRARCIITPTDSWYAGSAGGVAYLKSYRGPDDGWSDTIPCWCWNNNTTAIMAMTISHELGHMMDLSHDGTPFDEYYAGHDSGQTGWGPIMGAPFTKSLIQWSKGEYPNANNTEDDFAIISSTVAEPAVGHSYRADDFGNTTATASPLAFTSPINQTGIITTAADVDFFSFKTAGGNLSVSVMPPAPEPNLDAQVELYNDMGTLLSTSLQLPNALGSTLSTTLPTAGVYYLAVRGRGRPASTGVIGYTNYGSVGAYTISGSYVPLPELPLFVQEPSPILANQGAKVSFTTKVLSNSALTYQWYKIVGATDVKLTGKTAATLGFTSLQPGDAGDYKLIAKNATGTTSSAVANVDVHFKPIIRTQPLPSKQTVPVGATVSYSVLADGTPPLTYQWKKNGTLLAGETASTLNLGAVDWYDGGATYTVTVTNALGSAASAGAALTVTSGPLFKTQPLPAGQMVKPIALGGAASVSVQVVGTATIKYQWFKDTLPITGATKSSFSWSATKLTAEGVYFVRATNTTGSTDSDSFTVDVQDRPVIDTSPVASTTLAADQPLALDCTAHGTPTLLYQWQLNGKNVIDSVTAPIVTGATSPNLRIPAMSWLLRGTWRCVVTNAVGIATTKNAVVNVSSYPLILAQPTSIKIAKNGTGTLKVVAGGSTTLKYQWLKDNVIIPKATASSLTLSKASVATTNGSYTVQVTNTQPLPVTGTVTSNPATVTVEDPPIVAPPSPLTQVVGVGDNVMITGNVTQGAPVLRFQWQKNSKDIPGATTQNLSLNNVQTTDSASYRLKVTNDVGTAYSATAKVTVQIRPTISTPPAALTVYEYDPVTFTVKAGGSATLLYQWYFNSVPITGNSTAKTATLKITSARAAAAGLYNVTVTNAVGSTTSTSAQLTVNPVPLPTLSDLRPTNVVVGSKMDAFGTNLNWTTKVTVNGKVASFVKLRSNELIVTVPTGIATTGSFVVDTLGGQVAWPSFITKDTDGAENDDVVNAKLLYGTDITGSCDSTHATYQSGEYTAGWGRSVWFRWLASYTGKAAFTTFGTNYHNATAIYSGPFNAQSPFDLHFVDTFQDHFGNVGSFNQFDTDAITLDVTKGTYYYAMVDAAHNDGFYGPDYGPTYMRVVKVNAMPKAVTASAITKAEGFKADAPLDGQQGWQAEGGAAKVERDDADYVGVIGGQLSPGASAVAASLAAEISSTAIVHGTAEFRIDPGSTTGEQFSWALYDHQGLPVVALLLDGANHSIQAQVSGQVEDTTQILVPGASYELDLEADLSQQTWSISLNGVAIAQGNGLVVPAGGISHLAAGWRPADGAHTGGVMKFGHVSITSESNTASDETQP